MQPNKQEIFFKSCEYFILDRTLYIYFFVLQDKTLKSTIYRITGSIPAGNYIQLPRTSSQSLGLTGRYMYLMFKPIPSKFFVIHLDLVTHDGLIVRLSFSNLFKEFKSTSTWLQFPYLCHADYRTVSGRAAENSRGLL